MRSNIRRLRVESLESRQLLAADLAPLDVEACVAPEPTVEQADQRVSVSYCKDRESAKATSGKARGEWATRTCRW